LSDQTEKPKGALPKGYEPNAQGESQDQDKKIWDKYYNGEIELPDVVKELKRYRSSEDTELETSDEDQREKDLKEYESSYLTRVKKDKPEKSSDDFRVELGISTESDVDLGRLNLRKHAVIKRREYLAERKKYEQKYLSRYKQPKSGVKKSTSWTQHDVALGRLTLSPHFNAKRRAKQDEIREYEKQYLSRYKQPKTKKNVGSGLYKPEIPKPKRDMRKERKEYEQKYLSRYKQPKTKKNTSS